MSPTVKGKVIKNRTLYLSFNNDCGDWAIFSTPDDAAVYIIDSSRGSNAIADEVCSVEDILGFDPPGNEVTEITLTVKQVKTKCPHCGRL